MLICQPSYLQPQPLSRRGAVLLVVIAFLVLFAGVALAFVFYAQSEAITARNNRDSQNNVTSSSHVDVSVDVTTSLFYGAFLFGNSGDSSGVESATRGYDFGTSTYGYNTTPGAWNTTAFNGSGRWHTGQNPGNSPYMNPYQQDDFNLVNYTYFAKDGFLRDPERIGKRANPNAPMGPYWGSNVSYTYPDLNNLFLSAINGNGEILIQSYYRPWTGIGMLDKTQNPQGFPDMWNANPAVVPPYAKYLTLRPLPSQHLGFPPPADGGGDVKNWEGGPGVPIPGQPGKYYNNDSIWIDMGAPVMVASDGTKYKALFAPLIVDLDGKVNVNAHGNIRLAGNGQAGSQSWGSWEVNLNRILTQGQGPNLFLGANGIVGRYGSDGQPGTKGSQAPGSPETPPCSFVAMVDFDGTTGPIYGPSAPLLLPGANGNGNPSYFGFPNFAFNAFPSPFSNTYGQGNAYEVTNHPAVFNPFSPTFSTNGSDRTFPTSEMDSLWRYPGTGTTSSASQLFQLCPQEFLNSSDPVGSARRRLLVATNSMDVCQAGATPWLAQTWQTPNQTAPYIRNPNDLFPKGAPIASAPVGTTNAGEYGQNGQGATGLYTQVATGQMGRIDLNRKLTNYPQADPTTGQIPNNLYPTFLQAQTDRQNLARDIFNLLRWTATGEPPGSPFPPANSPPYDAERYLAQLAVNIVDYRDTDCYITPFNWNPSDPTPGGWVYGVELPRLVINEAYAEAVNNPADLAGMKALNPYQVNFYVELHNPFLQDPNLNDDAISAAQTPAQYSVARLQMPAAGYPVYQVLLTTPGQGNKLMAFSNTSGQPAATDILSTVTNYPQVAGGVDPTVVLASNGNYSAPAGGNQGFYVLGPTATAGYLPQPTSQSPNMSLTLPITTNVSGQLPSYGVVLQRLCCPYLPPNFPGNPNAPFDPNLPYNPYVTVDIMDNVPTNNGVAFTPGGPNPGQTLPPGRAPMGRMQPYAATATMAQNPGNANGPQHTFFRHNAVEANAPPMANTPGQTLKVPFDWLTHLDRQVISTGELLNVAGCPPHLLTQQFQTPATHLAPWLNSNSRLYRVLEFLQTRSRAAGVANATSTRPGLINLNTIYDLETLLALIDPQPGNSFSSSVNVQNVFSNMIKSRSPDLWPLPPPGNSATGYLRSGNDRPFRSFATGFIPQGQDPQYPNGASIEDTILRSDPNFPPGQQRLFGVQTATHPYLQNEMVTKMLNNCTVRSNVFAVWMTVGFFQVMDDTTLPVKLGPEIGAAQNQQVRHRSFAIIDRSALCVPSYLTSLGATVNPPQQPPQPQTVAVGAISGTAVAGPPVGVTMNWALVPGTLITVDAGNPLLQETVTVTNVTPAGGGQPPTITATFTRPHAQNAPVTVPGTPGPTGWGGTPTQPIAQPTVLGNPGPQANYNVGQNSAVVLYSRIID